LKFYYPITVEETVDIINENQSTSVDGMETTFNLRYSNITPSSLQITVDLNEHVDVT
jgi:hypothetical protein